jgi:hypothetical protein
MSPLPPLLKNAQSKDKGVAGRKAEKIAAKRVGAVLTPGSGVIEGAKGDYKLGDFLIENKTTQSESYTLKQGTLHKIYQEALERTKVPALAVQYVNSQGQSDKRDRWIMVPEHVFKQLIGG